jgi:hypothetical protein
MMHDPLSVGFLLILVELNLLNEKTAYLSITNEPI